MRRLVERASKGGVGAAALGFAASSLPVLLRPDLPIASALSAVGLTCSSALVPSCPRAASAILAGLALGLPSLSMGVLPGLAGAMVGAVAALCGSVVATRTPSDFRTDWVAEFQRRASRGNNTDPGRTADKLVREAARIAGESVDRLANIARAALRAHRVTVLWIDPRTQSASLVAASPDGPLGGPWPERAGFLGQLRRSPEVVLRVADAGAPQPPWRAPEVLPAHVAGVALYVDGVARGYLVAERETSSPPFGDREGGELAELAAQILDVLAREELIGDAARARSDVSLHFVAANLFNSTVTVEEVCRAARDIIERIVPVDLFVVTRTTEPEPVQQVVYAENHHEPLVGRTITEATSYLGVAVRQLELQPFTGVVRPGDPPLIDSEVPLDAYRSVRVFPMAMGGNAIGAIVLGTQREGGLDAATCDRLRVVVQLATAAFASAQAYAFAVRMATTDSMTGLVNHRTFKERAADALARAERSGRPMSLILFDIDHFKRVNDTYGHSVGDEVIIGVADVVKSTLRRVDLGARYGGEEFAVVVEETDTSAAFALAERIREAVGARTYVSDGQKFSVTLSLGVATYPQHSASVSDLIETADRALYAAKRGGRNRTVRAGNAEHQAA